MKWRDTIVDIQDFSAFRVNPSDLSFWVTRNNEKSIVHTKKMDPTGPKFVGLLQAESLNKDSLGMMLESLGVDTSESEIIAFYEEQEFERGKRHMLRIVTPTGLNHFTEGSHHHLSFTESTISETILDFWLTMGHRDQTIMIVHEQPGVIRVTIEPS